MSRCENVGQRDCSAGTVQVTCHLLITALEEVLIRQPIDYSVPIGGMHASPEEVEASLVFEPIRVTYIFIIECVIE